MDGCTQKEVAGLKSIRTDEFLNLKHILRTSSTVDTYVFATATNLQNLYVTSD